MEKAASKAFLRSSSQERGAEKGSSRKLRGMRAIKRAEAITTQP